MKQSKKEDNLFEYTFLLSYRRLHYYRYITLKAESVVIAKEEVIKAFRRYRRIAKVDIIADLVWVKGH